MDNIRKLRQYKGMTQNDFAILLGIKQQTVCKYETISSEISLNILKKISSIFKIPIDVLVDENVDIVDYVINVKSGGKFLERSIIDIVRRLDGKKLKILLEFLKELSKDV